MLGGGGRGQGAATQENQGCESVGEAEKKEVESKNLKVAGGAEVLKIIQH